MECIHEHGLAELADGHNWWCGLDPFPEEAAVQSVEVIAVSVSRWDKQQRRDLRGRRHIKRTDEQLPCFWIVSFPHVIGTGEDAICGFSFADIWLVIEESGILTVEDLLH